MARVSHRRLHRRRELPQRDALAVGRHRRLEELSTLRLSNAHVAGRRRVAQVEPRPSASSGTGSASCTASPSRARTSSTHATRSWPCLSTARCVGDAASPSAARRRGRARSARQSSSPSSSRSSRSSRGTSRREASAGSSPSRRGRARWPTGARRAPDRGTAARRPPPFRAGAQREEKREEEPPTVLGVCSICTLRYRTVRAGAARPRRVNTASRSPSAGVYRFRWTRSVLMMS